jgi:heterotetrameric sarcosine oxidase gamma subunit
VFVRDLIHESAFTGLRAAGAGDGVVAVERVGLAIATMIQRRGQSRELSAAVTANFAIDLPVGAEWTANNGVAWLGTGPGKWLAISESRDTDFVGKLEAKLGGFASVIDQSDGLGVLRLTGPALFKTLQKGVQIDLAPDAFPTGSVAVTSIAHIGATLWKVDDQPTVDIAVARSLCSSFLHWLEASAALYGLTVLRGVS